MDETIVATADERIGALGITQQIRQEVTMKATQQKEC